MTPLILPYQGEYALQAVSPRIAASAFIAANAAVIGDVEIGEESSIWYGCVVRGDVHRIRIGNRTNIQDGTVVHVTRGTGPTLIGSNVTIGHAALLHACTLEDNSFIGMRATLMDGVVVENGAQVAAGALVTPGKRIPTGELWAGSPARLFRKLTPEEQAFISESADNYVRLSREHLRQP
ncbi:MAG: gamma carbonic anhydrase family protein [Alphaproteobacteria bacterium]|nr:gamma carbonic anhydrase family protein [Alphaproteobacteria bacterium]